MLSSRSKRWADDAGVFFREKKMKQKPYRPRGEDGILYAHKKYKGEHLQDCLDTIDENIADRRVLQLMIDVDEGRYQPGKKVVSAKNRRELTKPGAEEPKFYTDCIAKYFASLDKDREKKIVSNAYYQNERYLCNKHIIRSQVFAGLTISEITEIDPKTGVSPLRRSINQIEHSPRGSVKKLGMVIEKIIRMGDPSFVLLAHFKSDDPKKKPKLPGIKGFYQTQFLLEPQAIEIMDNLDERFCDLAKLMAYSGLDLSEAINLTWGEVDRVDQVIVKNRGKNPNQPRKIPIRGQLEKMLKMRFLMHQIQSPDKKVKDDQKVLEFPRAGYKAGAQIKDPGRVFQKKWKKALKDSSIGWNVRPKDLRHFFASTMLNRGANPMEIANQMGHADVQMLIERYGKYSVAKLHEASKVWDRVEESVQMVCKQEDW